MFAGFINVEFDVCGCLEISFCQISKLGFFVSCNTFLFYVENKMIA